MPREEEVDPPSHLGALAQDLLLALTHLPGAHHRLAGAGHHHRGDLVHRTLIVENRVHPLANLKVRLRIRNSALEKRNTVQRNTHTQVIL